MTPLLRLFLAFVALAAVVRLLVAFGTALSSTPSASVGLGAFVALPVLLATALLLLRGSQRLRSMAMRAAVAALVGGLACGGVAIVQFVLARAGDAPVGLALEQSSAVRTAAGIAFMLAATLWGLALVAAIVAAPGATKAGSRDAG